MDFQPEIVSTEIDGIRIHGIPTGRVRVKESHRQPSIGLAKILVDPRWTEWLPIYTWVIQHPEGNILIDTGENVQVKEKSYFRCDRIGGLVYRAILEFDITEEQELPAQLAHIHLKPEDIRWIVVTHFHLDHLDGAKFFPQAEFVVSKIELERPSPGHIPCLLPKWFNPRSVDYTQSSLPGFEQAFSLTNAKDVLLVPTPGHTYGHQSLLLLQNDSTVFFAGDTTFNLDQLENEEVAGICVDPKLARETLRTIKTYARSENLIYLPSHDPHSGDRLKKQITV